MIYISNSCFSDVKAIAEIESARSSHLVVIPATNVTFGGLVQNRALATLLSFLREGKSFPAIRSQMALADIKYEKKTHNHFIFPDEPIYEERIHSKTAYPIDILVKLLDDNHNEYRP